MTYYIYRKYNCKKCGYEVTEESDYKQNKKDKKEICIKCLNEKREKKDDKKNTNK